MESHTVSVIFIEPLLGELKRDMFEDAGWKVVLRRFGGRAEHAITQLHTDQPDLIVLDYFANQEEAARNVIAALQQDQQLHQTPLLVCRYSDQDIRVLREALAGSISVIVSRPYSVEAFMRHAERLVSSGEA
jgi:CheY-like chemotaxis protein